LFLSQADTYTLTKPKYKFAGPLAKFQELQGKDKLEELKKYYDDRPYSDDDIYELYN
jgi:hypothetical protein